jgi:hypothetical protein
MSSDAVEPLLVFLAAVLMVVVVIGGGVWMAVRAGDAAKREHPARRDEGPSDGST